MSGFSVTDVACIGPARLTAGFQAFDRLNLVAQAEVHGDLKPLRFAELVELAEWIQLRGRGGAGFPFAQKLRAVAESARRRQLPTKVVVNATEGEPASWKDKMLLTRAPHLVIDGAVLAATALDAKEIVIGVADDGVGEASLLDALRERRYMPTRTRVVTVPHRFLSGEGGALVRGINGEPHIPPGTKIRASDSGVDGLPTLLSNAETYAQLAVAASIGPEEYTSIGTVDEPGTVLLTISGAARWPSVVEAPTGVPLKEALRLCQATPGQGVLTGGYHGKWITPEAATQAEVSRQSFAEVGGALGAGIIIPLPEDTCPLGEVARVMHYMAVELAGQCGPCRLGLPEMARLVTGVLDGSAAPDAIRAVAGAIRGRGACTHPDGTSRFALSALEVFGDDVSAHLYHDGCGRPVRGVLPVPEGTADVSPGRLEVDWSRCDGHGLCAHILPEVIQLDSNGFPALSGAQVPSWLEPQARRAVDMCPALALRLTGMPGQDTRGAAGRKSRRPRR